MAYAKKLANASVDEFFGWINERHNIYVNRFDKGMRKPWTQDHILRTYKFTNVFRQLDKGTIALNKMLGKWHRSTAQFKDMEMEDAIDILFNVVWYRLFNRYEHAEDIGFQHSGDHEKIRQLLIHKRDSGQKVFTNAHMVCSPKVAQIHGKLYAALIGPIGIHEGNGQKLVSYMYHNPSMQKVTKKLCEIPMVGSFVGYEIACDLRFTPLMKDATDLFTWANLGPGAKRGLIRLGMEPGYPAMVELYNIAVNGGAVSPEVFKHIPNPDNDNVWPPFELREIEHSLCEFDKYIRAREAEGRTRMRYDG